MTQEMLVGFFQYGVKEVARQRDLKRHAQRRNEMPANKASEQAGPEQAKVKMSSKT